VTRHRGDDRRLLALARSVALAVLDVQAFGGIGS
jgi:hypothetical protein